MAIIYLTKNCSPFCIESNDYSQLQSDFMQKSGTVYELLLFLNITVLMEKMSLRDCVARLNMAKSVIIG